MTESRSSTQDKKEASMIALASNTADTGSPATPPARTPRPWLFFMIDSKNEVVGSGVIVAPNARAARVTAARLLAGTNSVVILDHASNLCLGRR